MVSSSQDLLELEFTFPIDHYQGKKNVSGEMIRQLRIKKRMSQSDLAARLQVEGVMLERDSISRIESGTRFVADYELFIFAKVFGVEMAELLELQKNP